MIHITCRKTVNHDLSKITLLLALAAVISLTSCNSTSNSYSSDINDPAVTGYEVYDTNAPASTVSTPAATGKTYEYTIQPGDSLWKLARDHNTTIAYIMQLNNLQDDMIRVEDKLMLPEISVTTPPAAYPVTP
ncbi:MAG: LysM peptidoglycan-binding domain-containing protein [Verrucomicrobiota bacterium]